MSIRYDENTKARAVRLVREHREDYDSEWAAMKAIAGRLGMNPETLRKWVRQAEIDAGAAAGGASGSRRVRRRGCRARRGGSCGSYDARTASWNKHWKYSRPQQVSSRGSATRDTADLRVHRRAPRTVRGRTDLPGPRGARRADRPAHLLGAPLGGAVETGPVGHHDHRNPRRLLRARRRRETPAGELVRQPEDVGAPAAPGHT